jgi:hypothetical protein
MDTSLWPLVERLDTTDLAATNVIPWSSPVPSFGDISSALVATLGLNPSNREFVDETGNELDGPFRRFHTLKSLSLNRWSEATSSHLRLIADSCRGYFRKNPYDLWFKKLDNVISGTGSSYYSTSNVACHLDLIPYATACKWTDLKQRQRSALLRIAADTLGLLLRESPVRLLILNGNSVVANLQELADVTFEKQPMPSWNLPRVNISHVCGFSYRGCVRRIAGIRLHHELTVVGFNHNIQSSFGVTRTVMDSIRRWIANVSEDLGL